MEILDMKKIRCQAKVVGTAVTVAGAMLMTLYKGNVVNMFWSKYIHPSTYEPTTTAVDADKDWVKGSILLIIATFAWASFFILQVLQFIIFFFLKKICHSSLYMISLYQALAVFYY